MIIEDWGLIDYELANQRQLECLEKVASGAQEDTLVVCTHPPVVTLGRGSDPADLIGWKGAVVETSRGGRATYHGPSQLVIYPIIDLKREGRAHLKPRDVHGYLRALETAVVEGLRRFDVVAEARTVPMKNADGSELSVTGVWVGPRKLASIGIAVRKWITYHGVAINVANDPNAFSGIKPCGFSAGIMTSLEELGVTAPRAEIQSELLKRFQVLFA